MSDHQPRHVFISYVRDNQDQVDRLCEDLKTHGVNVWLDRHSIKPGARWKSAIQEAIRNGNFFIACFSKEYTSKSKTYMNEELILAIEELRQYDSEQEWFIPVLLSECDVPARSIGAGETLLDINWVPLYENWDAGIQRILSIIRPIPPEIQNLISALRSDYGNVRIQAVKTLQVIGDSLAVTALIEALKDKDKNIRKATLFAFMELGAKAKIASSAVCAALKDPEAVVRESAAGALRWISPEIKLAIPALIEALKDENKDVRITTILALSDFGPDASAAVPTLIETLKDEDQMVRKDAAEALEKINTPEAQRALEEYEKRNS